MVHVLYSFMFLSFLSVAHLSAMDVDQTYEQSFIQALGLGDVQQFSKFGVKDIVNKVLMLTKNTLGQVVNATPLLYAVYEGNEQLVAQLLALGASSMGNEAATTFQSDTPLQVAHELHYQSIVSLIKNAWLSTINNERKKLAQAMEINLQVLEGRAQEQEWYESVPVTKELDTVAMCGFRENVMSGNVQKIYQPWLFINKPIMNLVVDDGSSVMVTPLLYAVYTQNLALVEALLDMGAIPYGKLDDARMLGTPLQYARKLGNSAITDVLRKASLSILKMNFCLQLSQMKSILAPTNQVELLAGGALKKTWSIDDAGLINSCKFSSVLRDQKLLLEECTLQELEQFIDLGDMSVTKKIADSLGQVEIQAQAAYAKNVLLESESRFNNMPTLAMSAPNLTGNSHESDDADSCHSTEQPASTTASYNPHSSQESDKQ